MIDRRCPFDVVFVPEPMRQDAVRKIDAEASALSGTLYEDQLSSA